MTLLYTLLWQTISEHSKKSFFLGSFLTEVRSLGRRSATSVKKKIFASIFQEYLKFKLDKIISFLSSSRKISVGEFLDRQQAVDCTHAIVTKRNYTTYIFLDIFKSFWCSYFNIPYKLRFLQNSWLQSIVLYATLVNFQMNIVYRRKIKN